MSRNLTKTLETTRDDHLVAWLAALAITIHILESALPSPIPGIKPGFANMVTVAALILFGWRTAAWVAFLRVIVGSIMVGTFLSPTFVMSASGATASIIVLGIAYRLPVITFSAIGYAVLAALAHMATQFWVAYLLFIPHDGLFNLLPIFMTAALIFGITTGVITHLAVKEVQTKL